MKRQAVIGLLLLLTFCRMQAQYISQVLDYRPAPGQFVNSLPWAAPSSVQSVIGGITGSLSLGAFGGSVIFRFADPVENHPDNPFGVDFTIFGNPLPDWSEPGAVWVMKDENENGQPDDKWFQLAGSDYYFSSTQFNYSLSYTNPGGMEASDVPWVDEADSTGVIKANSVHTQTYYPLQDSFPSIDSVSMEVEGTRIYGYVDVDHPPLLKSLRRAFGYADNQYRGEAPHTVPDNPYTREVENSGGDAFDIDWAIDTDGEYVDLDHIDFIKVETAILHQGGYLGEISTEITGAVDVNPNHGMQGEEEILVIRDLPLEMDSGIHQLEAIHFLRGRPVQDSRIEWTSSKDWASVDERQLLNAAGTGPLSLTARVEGKPQLECTVNTVIREVDLSAGMGSFPDPALRIYPNPASDYFRIVGCSAARLSILDSGGRLLQSVPEYHEGSALSTDTIEAGFYLVGVHTLNRIHWLKLRIL